MTIVNCELCERHVEALTVHHLVPRQKTKRKKLDPGPTANLCSACHRQIHHLYDNTRLAQDLNSIEALKSQPEIQKFLSWVKKQKSDKKIRVR